MSVTLKRLNVDGVEYVEVEEDSPLLPKRSPEEKRNQRRERWFRVCCLALIAFGALLLAIGLVKNVLLFPLLRHQAKGKVPTFRKSQDLHASLAVSKFQRARVRVREDRPYIPSFWNYGPHGPINVTYDERAIMLNGDRVLFLSGSMHPVRATHETWALALDEAVRQGLNMVTVYVFWQAHQPFPNMDFDWSFPGGWSLADAIRAAANRGLFCHVRIGPYVCAEYNYGGIPEWVPLGRPNMVMRRLNEEWMNAMEVYVKETVRYLKEEKLFSYQGGPIVMAQIENELGGEDDDEASDSRSLEISHHESEQPKTIQEYADWCGDLASRVAPNVLWTMCNGLTAANTINTCNGYGGAGCSTTWLESHGQTGRIQVDQPALWTEAEQGFQTWGEVATKPSDYFWGVTAREIAREGLQWFARGGSHLNYYMWWGGYNRGRAAASGIMNMYANDACLCSSGQRRQPKFGHLRDFHEAISTVAHILMESESALAKARPVEYRNERGDWTFGTKQRMFIYRRNDGEEVIFLENDAEGGVEVRIPISGMLDEKIFYLNPLSSALLVDGLVIFDSSSINPRNQWYRRVTGWNDVKLLDWRTWPEPIGVSDKDKVSVVSSRPIEQTKLMVDTTTYSDFAWFETDIDLISGLTNATIRIETQKASAFSLFLDGRFLGSSDNHEHAEGNITLTTLVGSLPAGKHNLSFLSESLGYFNLIGRWNASTQAKTKGITGNVILSGTINSGPRPRAFSQDLVDGREWRSSPGLHSERDAIEPETRSRRNRNELDTSKPSLTAPCSWSVLFDTPNYDATIQGLFLDIKSGRGHFSLNGFDLGRFWNITRGSTKNYSQRYYFLPNELLFTNGTLNKLVMFDDLGGNHSLTQLVLSWLEMDEDFSMEDEVDWPSACI